ncbi:hypothetical protein CSAL01_13350 [Colletotrichum salicis]|uniref:Uncharacterized protein n=1 Tax=Colletotrichum salicis TaxID=1209931 RepID=A0A135RS16_9PEZI|nr:hypothetical protein CSAL01_13350 [Colletotrichum salicis]
MRSPSTSVSCPGVYLQRPSSRLDTVGTGKLASQARLLQHAIVKLSWHYGYLGPKVTAQCPPLEEHFSEWPAQQHPFGLSPESGWSLHGSSRPPQQKTSKSLPMARNFLRHARQDSHVPRFFSDFLPDCHASGVALGPVTAE